MSPITPNEGNPGNTNFILQMDEFSHMHIVHIAFLLSNSGPPSTSAVFATT